MADEEARAGCCLADDLIELSILPRLPANSLLKLRSVSRRWHRTITDPYFIHLQSQSAPSLLMGERTGRSLGAAVHGSIGIPRLYWGSDGKNERRTVLASCSGLLCLMCSNFYYSMAKVYIGNPCLRDWMLIPDPFHGVPIYHPEQVFTTKFGLAVDVGKSDVSYKLVRVGSEGYNGSVKHRFHVLSSRTGSWEMNKRSIVASHRSWLRGVGVCVRAGVMYWLCANYHSTDDHVLWFDSKDERSGFHPLPFDCSKYRRGAIGEWNGELSYVRIVGVERIEIWSMDHQSCWTKKHSASLEKIFHGDLCDVVQPSWMVMVLPFEGGNAFLFDIKGELYRYDMVTGEAQKQVGSFFGHSVFPYKSSLVPVSNLGMALTSVRFKVRYFCCLIDITAGSYYKTYCY